MNGRNVQATSRVLVPFSVLLLAGKSATLGLIGGALPHLSRGRASINKAAAISKFPTLPRPARRKDRLANVRTTRWDTPFGRCDAKARGRADRFGSRRTSTQARSAWRAACFQHRSGDRSLYLARLLLPL